MSCSPLEHNRRFGGTCFQLASICTLVSYFKFFNYGGLLGTSVTNCPVVPALDDRRVLSIRRNESCKRNSSTWRRLASVLLCSPQITHDLAWDRTKAAVVVSRRYIALVRARPILLGSLQPLTGRATVTPKSSLHSVMLVLALFD
jgi:hypothetical protein